jgi:hypothetical protein
MKKAIRDQAEKLIRDYGDNAYDKAYEAVRTARRHRNGRLERFLEKVAREIARLTHEPRGGDRGELRRLFHPGVKLI